jgi:uncharacterized protein YigA (DUF484 family)
MSTQLTHNINQPMLDEQTVAGYLRRHPDFFAEQQDLLAELLLPHPSGRAVSLIERQVTLLRDQNQRLRQQLQSLVRNARNNEALSERFHLMTLSLLRCGTAEEVFYTLRDRLCGDFDADAVTVCIMPRAGKAPSQTASENGLAVRHIALKDLQNFDQVLEAGDPVCGRLTKQQLLYLFGDTAEQITSAALIPLKAGDQATPALTGVIGIGSRDSQRFQAGMGTVFLVQLAEIITAVLRPYLE